MYIIQCRSENVMKAKLRLQSKGPVCDSVCEPAARLAGKWNIPMVSYGCAGQGLSNRKLYPTFSRTSPTYLNVVYFLEALLKHYKWDRLVLVEGPQEIWRETTVSYQIYLEQKGFQTEIWTIPSEDELILKNHLQRQAGHNRNTSEKEPIFPEVSGGGVFVICAYGEDIIYLMCAAEETGLLNGEYVFITVDFAFMTKSSPRKRSCNINTDLEGLLDITVEIDYNYENFENFVYWIENKTGLNHSHEVGIHAGMLYDAVKLFAYAVNDSLTLGHDVHDGLSISEKLVHITFQGMTGVVDIDDSGTRLAHFMLHNIQNGQYITVATTNYKSNFIYFHENVTVLWPGGTNVKPLGRPLCGWQGEYCDDQVTTLIISLVICAAAFLTGLAAILLRWRRKKSMEESMESMTWKIDYSDITTKADNKMSSSKSSRTTFNSSSQTLNRRLSFDSQVSSSGQLFTKIAEYKGMRVALKLIHKPYIALTPELIQEMNQIRALKNAHINPVLGACVEPMKICTVSVYCCKGSLQDVLENDNIKLDWIFKISFTSDIARGMVYLHNTPIKSHGHLKSSSVLIDSHWICKIGDISMPIFQEGERISLGKHAQYYQLLWTAPEILRDPELYPRGTQKGDVYSFAIIMQEIVLRSGPFGNAIEEPEDIISRVWNCEHPPYRPKVPSDMADEALLDLMRICWEEIYAFRPNFPSISIALKKINNGKNTNLVDQMIHMMEKYADHLEELVNERTQQLEMEQRKTEDLLCRMLPKSIANDLKIGKHIVPETYDSVTIFFSDIVGFTVLASYSTPMEVVNFLNDLYTCFDTIIENYDVYKIETIGDAYMVVSGLPVRNGILHAGEIATMSLDLLSSVTIFKIRHQPEKRLQLRIGLHSGPVAAGVVGLKMPRYCLFGDTVNYASRMESTGHALHIHVSPECKILLDALSGFRLQKRGPVTLKGKGVVETFFLLGKDGFHKAMPVAGLNEHQL